MTETQTHNYAFWHKFHDNLFTVSLVRRKKARIDIINTEKTEFEIPLRLKLFKYSPALTKLLKPYNITSKNEEFFLQLPLNVQQQIIKLHKKECPRCTWIADVTQCYYFGTIFKHRYQTEKHKGYWY